MMDQQSPNPKASPAPQLATSGGVQQARRDRLLPVLALSAALLLGGILSTCSPQRSPWEQIRQSNSLTVITFNNATTYYEGPDGPTGFEYDLARRFAEYLRVELRVVTASTPEEMIQRLLKNEAQMAAGLTVTEERSEWLRFGPALYTITPQVVYRSGSRRPRKLESLIEATADKKLLELPLGSSYVSRLSTLEEAHPELHWVENPYANSEELLTRVADGDIDFTIANSHLIKLTARYHPKIRVAFDFDEPRPLAWAFAPEDADTLLPLAETFVAEIQASGELKRTIDRYFSDADNLGYVGAVKFAEHVRTRLPLYEATFKKEAKKHNLDWRLLAAVGYQESHWNPKAVSPTGVRGLMMLTRATAKQMGVRDRTDPIQSIQGGARYLREQIDRQPPEITEPDRTWMALATYNIGHGHMIDVRRLTAQLGGSPWHWVDVRKHLPLLMQARWHQRLRHGYARGREAMRYVANIRSYYDILRWMTTTEEMAPPEGVDPALIPRPDPATRALEIDSPFL